MTIDNFQLFARLSLSFLWVHTGVVSALASPEIGYEILLSAGIEGLLADASLWLGSIADFAIGIWLLTDRALKLCYLLQLCLIAVYTLLLTFIDASFWLHPFGPVTKNLPIVVMIYYLYSLEVHGKPVQSKI